MSDAERPDSPGEITELLREASHGSKEAFDRLFPRVYSELNALARHRLRLERPGHTLSTTALVHEAYLKLVDQTRVEWQGRRHFFAVASEAMRRILVDHAKYRQRDKRGGGAAHVGLDAVGELPDEAMTADQAAELIALDDALARLAVFNPQGAQIVQYRFFGGLSTEEVAGLLETSERSVRRAWTVAKAWLRRELDDALDGAPVVLLGGDPGTAS